MIRPEQIDSLRDLAEDIQQKGICLRIKGQWPDSFKRLNRMVKRKTDFTSVDLSNFLFDLANELEQI